MQLPSLPQATLRGGVNRLEDAIITLSGPALAVSGIIAGVDLLTGGNAMRQYGGLALAWAVCLLLTLDFQVLGLGAKAHKVYVSNKSGWQKVIEIVLAVLIAAAISYVSVQMQSIIARANSVPGLSIEAATVQLGINPIALIWERSALVLVLIFMSGWFREEKEQRPATGAQMKQGVSTETARETPAISDETVQIILAKLAKLDALEQALSGQGAQVTSVQEIAPAPLALPDGAGETGSETAETEEERATLEAQIAALLAESPTLSSREVAARLDKPHTTVYRTMTRVKQSVKQ